MSAAGTIGNGRPDAGPAPARRRVGGWRATFLAGLMVSACATSPLETSDPVAVPVPPASAVPIEIPRDVGGFRALYVQRSEKPVVTSVILDGDAASLPILGLAEAPARVTVETAVNGHAVDLGPPHCTLHWEGGESDPAPTRFRVAIWFRSALAPGARSLMLRGTLPLKIGLEPQSTAATGSLREEGLSLRDARGGCWRTSEMRREGRMRFVDVSCHGTVGLDARPEFLGGDGRVVPSSAFDQDFGTRGVGGMRFPQRIWLAGEAEVAGLRVTTYGRTATWNAPIDVSVPVLHRTALALFRAGGPPPADGAYVASVEIAGTGARRARGLQGRTQLDEDAGMLFAYPEPWPRAFWTKDCGLSVDIAFLLPDGTIESVETLAPGAGLADDEVPRATCNTPVACVLAMNGGWFRQHDIDRGAHVDVSAALEGIVPRGN